VIKPRSSHEQDWRCAGFLTFYNQLKLSRKERLKEDQKKPTTILYPSIDEITGADSIARDIHPAALKQRILFWA